MYYRGPHQGLGGAWEEGLEGAVHVQEAWESATYQVVRNFVYIFDINCFCFVEPDLLLIIKPSSGLVALICTYVQQDREGGWYILI